MADSSENYYQVACDGRDSHGVSIGRWFKFGFIFISALCIVLWTVTTVPISTHPTTPYSTRLVGWGPSFRWQSTDRMPSRLRPNVIARAATTNYKLCYWDARGVAETSRMLFTVSKTPFEDKRFTYTFGIPGNFSTIQKPEFDAAKASGELDMNLGKLPILEVNGEKFGQSKAIERYLANQLGLFGENDADAFMIDQLCEHVNDFRTAWTRLDKKAPGAVDKWLSEDLPKSMKLYEKSLPACAPGPWLVGNKISLADVVMYQFCAAPGGQFDNQFAKHSEEAKASFNECPKVKAAMEAVAALPELEVYLASRPASAF